MRAIFETSNQYQGLLDLQGNVLYANATALAGIRAGIWDVAGKPFWDTPGLPATEGMREIVREAFAAVLRGRERADGNAAAICRPASASSISPCGRCSISTAPSPGSLPEAVDITERRQAEEALRQSQKMDAIGQLTGGVAHDFNNLLTIIRSATDFLRRRDLAEDRRRRYVDAISDTVDRASKLTGQLLAFARRQPCRRRSSMSASQVESIAQLIRPLMGGRIQIDVELCDPACLATADVAQFETALVNLAVNARDAMAGEGRLVIHVDAVDAIPALRGQARRDGRFVAVSVTDTGSGIPADMLEAIFEPFFTTKDVGKGTGLGLSQALGFARQSGGEINVTSTRGEGATFTIYLPQAESSGDRARKSPPSAAKPRSSGRGHCVLVVEDDEEVGRFSTELLQDLGYAIKWAANAGDALAALAEDELTFDLVFSDVIMPGMNGVELANIIRDRYPGLPVVLTSGYSSVLADNAHRGFELIQKPYSVEIAVADPAKGDFRTAGGGLTPAWPRKPGCRRSPFPESVSKSACRLLDFPTG